MSDPDFVPKGVTLFAPNTPRAYRRRRLIFLAIWLGAAAAVIWPVYSLFAGPRPLILGLPLALVWLIFWLLVVFAALLWLYRSEPS